MTLKIREIWHRLKPYKTALIAVGAFLLGSIFAPLLVNYLSFISFESSSIRQESKIASAQRFIEDLEKIKVIAPTNTDLKECLDTGKETSFNANYELCISKIKQSQTESRTLLERNISSIIFFFGDDFYRQIESSIAELDYLLYEMGNNQYLLQHWQEQGCSDTVDFIPAASLTENMVTKDSNGKVKCALSIESTESFHDRINQTECNEKCVAALREGVISIESAKYAVIAGTQESLSEYFLKANSALYSMMLGEIDNLLNNMRTKIE